MTIESHPVRVTDRDVLKENSLDGWFDSFKGFDLHVRVLHARDLPPINRSGLPDPYCVLNFGRGRHRTATCHRTLDPDWGEEFILEWQDVNWAKRLLTLEVFDWDFWRPDTVLGRAFIDVNLLSFEPEEVQALDLQLYPPHVKYPSRRNKPSKAKIANVKLLTKQQQQQRRDQDGSSSDTDTGHHQEYQRLTNRHSSAALERGSSSHANGHVQQQQQQQVEVAVNIIKPVQYLGDVHVALWWAPSRAQHAFDVIERCSFSLLPGEAKVPPVMTHAKYGTLYEEPCVVYIKFSLIEVMLGAGWYDEYLIKVSQMEQGNKHKHNKGTNSTYSTLDDDDEHLPISRMGSASSSISNASSSYAQSAISRAAGGSWWRPGRRRQQQQQQQQQGRIGHFVPATAATAAEDDGDTGSVFGGSNFGDDYLGRANGNAGTAAALQQHSAGKSHRGSSIPDPDLPTLLQPVFALARVTFGKNQTAESQPVRVRVGGSAVFRENFVFTTKRPLQDKKVSG
eukprot:jgi/Chrzof1/9182/Cz03g38290.t1